jgi:hypothetical protein
MAADNAYIWTFVEGLLKTLMLNAKNGHKKLRRQIYIFHINGLWEPEYVKPIMFTKIIYIVAKLKYKADFEPVLFQSIR